MLGIHKLRDLKKLITGCSFACAAQQPTEVWAQEVLTSVWTCPLPASPQSQSALSRNNYIFECHMRQGPLSHAEKKPLLVKFLPAGKGRAQTSASSVYTKHPCWNPGWEHRVGRHICTGKCSIDDTRVTRAPQCSQNCPWVINQLLLWVLVAGIQLDLMTAGLHETIDLACGDSFWTGLATVFITS